jgi:hypothetical protein
MNPPRLLINVLVERVENYVRNHMTHTSRQDFELLKQRLVIELVRAAATDDRSKEVLSFGNYDQLEQWLRTRHPGVFRGGGPFVRLSDSFVEADSDRTRLRDMRKTVDWATSWDYGKTLIFRTLTTIMIAAVVLITAYLAHEWGIPLPMLRPLGM